jgi:hypothetical protein
LGCVFKKVGQKQTNRSNGVVTVAFKVNQYDLAYHQFILIKPEFDKKNVSVQFPRALVKLIREGKDLGKDLGFTA